jgi:hypothetical protein
MDDAQRDTIIAAHDAWRNAHRAYRDEVAKHVVWGRDWQEERWDKAESCTRREMARRRAGFVT